MLSAGQRHGLHCAAEGLVGWPQGRHPWLGQACAARGICIRGLMSLQSSLLASIAARLGLVRRPTSSRE